MNLRPANCSGDEDSVSMLSASEITALHSRLTEEWHQMPDQSPAAANEWLHLVALQHRANIDLWHIEDAARAPRVTDAELAALKRRIDTTNQRRNDLAEELDRALLAWLEARGLPNAAAPLHSESPGLMVDRLSILDLKMYHTREEAERKVAPEGHAERNRARLQVLEEQRADLAVCLDVLWSDTLKGARRFKLYRQMKMYNDPSLNPAVYADSPAANGDRYTQHGNGKPVP
jgi:hypothetical protein